MCENNFKKPKMAKQYFYNFNVFFENNQVGKWTLQKPKIVKINYFYNIWYFVEMIRLVKLHEKILKEFNFLFHKHFDGDRGQKITDCEKTQNGRQNFMGQR